MAHKKEETTKAKINLFKNIALTFSGGGYRAAAYGLGTLAYLNHVKFKKKPLLQNVKGLSTVSGGTLAGATYAYFMADGKDFNAFYSHFYRMLNKDKLLETALKKLDSDDIWKNSHKKRSLINAFALAYADLLTDGTFEFIKTNKSHLEDICFNATDFSFGLAFRFQTTGDFGNYRLVNSNLTLLSNEMKLADAIASSSCFPIGFEPLVMPDDYISNQDSDAYIAIKEQDDFKKGVGIMDGGIVDNQGIGSIINADTRRKKDKKGYDLIMVCDVGSYFMKPWVPAQIDMDKKGWTKTPIQLFDKIVGFLKSIGWSLLVVVIAIALLVIGFVFKPAPWLFILGGAFSLLAILVVLLSLGIKKLEKEANEFWEWVLSKLPGFMKPLLKYLKNLKLRLYKRMVIERGTSGMKMINDIFLKQLRRLNYNLLYANESLKDRRISSLIYELTEDQYKHNRSDEKGVEEKLKQIAAPGDRIYAAAKIAREMGTTLWFSQEDRDVNRLKNLVACGQFTACYNLLKYCIDLKEKGADVDQKLLDEMIKAFQKDWEKFVKDPYWLHG